MLSRHPKPECQRGVVLLLSLIVLAAMSLAAIGLMRSVLISNRVAGNLAFQQSATQSADVGLETAIAWLEQKARELEETPSKQKVPANKLFQDIAAGPGEPFSYTARREDPAPGQSWESFWSGSLLANQRVNTLPMDAAGNSVAFVIHRLCNGNGDSLNSGCEASAALGASTQTSSKSSGIKLELPSQVYYRITVRVQGPRNALSFVQAVVAI